jgi:endonuclease/exonuclease/phosphatase (EEP) superfamily protein YafD
MTVEATTPPRSVARTGHRHSVPKRRLPIWIAVVLWIVVGALALVAAMRLFAWDDVAFFSVLNAITVLVYLPAWIVAVVALIGRRRVLAGAALVIVVLQVVFLLPELTAAEPVPAWAATAPTIRLMDANVYAGNPSMTGYASQIEQDRPQLLTMEEAITPDVTELVRSGALAGLPYRIQVTRYDPRAFLVASAYPLLDTKVVYFDRLPLIVQTTIHLPSGNHALWVVHATAPLPPSFTEWKDELAFVDRQIHARGAVGLLVVGDFNATWGAKEFRTILDAGMTDGAAARGRPFDMTWSQIEHPLPPFVRIDHVLTGSGVAVTQIETGPGPGSDHRDLHATIAFRGQRGAQAARQGPTLDRGR